MTFHTLVVSFSTQALAHLGEMPHPITGEVRLDLPQAQQMIDILELLQEKTRGNLDAGEAALLEDVLYTLRMKFVERSRKRT